MLNRCSLRDFRSDVDEDHLDCYDGSESDVMLQRMKEMKQACCC